ncbi:MAG: hypothetical protein WBE26_19105, partial [Phycisphaerae bacterium]
MHSYAPLSLRTTLLTLFIILSTSPLFAQTHIPAGDVDGTWTLTGSPFYIDGNISIQDGTTLTIEPGVEVIFTGPYQLDVQGELFAEGTSTELITFTSNAPDGWNGIAFDETPATNSSIISYCILENGKKDIDRRCTIYPEYCGGAIYVRAYSGLDISHSILRNNEASRGGAIYCVAQSGDASPSIHDNEIHDNTAARGGGICCRADTGATVQPDITDNSIHHNTAWNRGGGIFADNLATPNI